MKKWILGICSGLLVTVGGGFILHHVTQPEPTTPVKREPIIPPSSKEKEKKEEPSKCSGTWKWNASTQRCEKQIVIPAKTFTIPLDEKISKVGGRIDFYMNRERLPGMDSQGKAMYRYPQGVLQVVVPVMKGNRMVGSLYEVIYRVKDGYFCEVKGLPETTGWFKKMQVAYSVRLDTDCNKSNSKCQVRLVDSGSRIHITTKSMRAVITQKRCL
ncbi:MAG: hypothetical protein AAF090_03165 [Bacteroidota bacterium]